MEDAFMFGFIMLMIAILISRIVSEKALKKLDADQRSLLIDQFSSQRIWSLGLIIVIVAGYFLALKTNTFQPLTMLALYLLVIAVFMLIQVKIALKKLHDVSIDRDYIRAYKLSTTIRAIGILLFFIILFIFK